MSLKADTVKKISQLSVLSESKQSSHRKKPEIILNDEDQIKSRKSQLYGPRVIQAKSEDEELQCSSSHKESSSEDLSEIDLNQIHMGSKKISAETTVAKKRPPSSSLSESSCSSSGSGSETSRRALQYIKDIHYRQRKKSMPITLRPVQRKSIARRKSKMSIKDQKRHSIAEVRPSVVSKKKLKQRKPS